MVTSQLDEEVVTSQLDEEVVTSQKSDIGLDIEYDNAKVKEDKSSTDILNEFEDLLNSNNNAIYDTYDKELDETVVKIYESPVPYERHIEAFNLCNPSPIILNTLLYGDKKYGDEFIKIYHGPPGTGKTWRLMKELKYLIDLSPREKILICAPSNIGVINLYNRALSFGINGCLILSKKKYPKNFKIQKKRKANIVFSTISMRHGGILRNTEFSTIIIDEAAQCQESWVWGLLRNRVTKLYMAGDPNQLPALVSEQGVHLGHGRSLMERLMKLGFPSELLNVQRRMHPKIVEFPNNEFYDGKLKTEYIGNYKIEPFKIINIEGKEKRTGNSYQNYEECLEIIKQVALLKKQFIDIVVISPYKAQCDLLKSMNTDLEIHTVDSFQGREADVILLMTVRTGNCIGFWKDFRRLNVAMTRAKHVLRIIGKCSTWLKTDNKLKKLYEYKMLEH